MIRSPYDDIADWYQEYRERAGYHEGDLLLSQLLGQGSGICIDLACGTGANFEIIRASGRNVVGVDLSHEMLRLPQTRNAPVIRADAGRLPLRDDSVDTVVCTYLHSDVDDMGSIFEEVHRILVPFGQIIYFGVHPCFTGHFVERREDGAYVIHPGYWDSGWHFESPYWGDGVRRRVGHRHSTLTELITNLLKSGLVLKSLTELRGGPIPWNLLLVAQKEDLTGSFGND